MITKTSSQNESVLLQIAEKLVLAKQELDELALQLSLGKTDAKDKYEEIKKEFRARLSELKQIVPTDSHKTAAIDLISKIVELEAALLTGKVDSKKVFDDQRRVIMSVIQELENAIVNRFGEVPVVNEFIHDIEKFKLKLEILRLKFTLKKFKIKNAFRTGMDEAVSIVRTAEAKVTKVKARYRNFRDEIGLAYNHMKKAVKKM